MEICRRQGWLLCAIAYREPGWGPRLHLVRLPTTTYITYILPPTIPIPAHNNHSGSRRTTNSRGDRFNCLPSILYSTLLYSTLLYSTLLYSTLLYSTLLHLLYFTLLEYYGRTQPWTHIGQTHEVFPQRDNLPKAALISTANEDKDNCYHNYTTILCYHDRT